MWGGGWGWGGGGGGVHGLSYFDEDIVIYGTPIINYQSHIFSYLGGGLKNAVKDFEQLFVVKELNQFGQPVLVGRRKVLHEYQYFNHFFVPWVPLLCNIAKFPLTSFQLAPDPQDVYLGKAADRG